MLNLNKFHKISLLCFRSPIIRYYSTSNLGKSKPNYYKILDISSAATPSEIKAAFHKKAKEHHPDAQTNRAAASKESEEKFKLAVEAYKILSDESSRKDYDESLKPKTSTQNSGGAGAWEQYSNTEGFGGSRVRYRNEKFYGDYNPNDQQNEAQYKYHSNVPPPNDQNTHKESPFWRNMEYETILIWGLVLVFALRWTMFVWDTDNLRRRPYSEVEKLDPNDEEEGIYIETKVPKDHSRPLTIRDCQGLRIEQLEELDRLGYILPKSVKEEVMDYRETHKLYKQKKRASYWNYNKTYAESGNLEEEEEEVIPSLKKPAVVKKKKTVREAADEVKREILVNSNEGGVVAFRKEDFMLAPQEDKTVGAGEVKIPRMKANLYNMEKNS